MNVCWNLTRPPSPHRSSSPELIHSVQSGAASWLSHITAGTAGLGAAGRAALPGTRPPLHPRVGALLQTYAASAAQLGAAGSAAGVSLAGAASNGGALAGPYASYGIGSTELVGAASGMAAAAAATAAGGTVTGPAGAKGAAAGKDVSVAWLKNAALAEWQRLNALSAV